MNKKELLDRCARDGEERILLARVLDKLELAQRRGVPTCTPFLSPGEQGAVTGLLHAWGRPRFRIPPWPPFRPGSLGERPSPTGIFWAP